MKKLQRFLDNITIHATTSWFPAMSSRFKLMALVVAFCCGQLNAQVIVPRTVSSSASKKNDAAARSLAALDLAVLAAESGIPDVSLEAVRRALGNGPPVSSLDLGGLLSPNQGQSRSSLTLGSNADETTNGQAKVASRLNRIHEAWKAQEIDPLACYQVLKDLVFPPERPSEAFPYSAVSSTNNYSYSLSLSEKEPDKVASGASLLTAWAEMADMQADLRAAITERGQFPGARATVQLLKILLAKDDPDLDAESLCEELSKQPNLLVSSRDASLLMSATYGMLQSMPDDSPAKNKLWSGVLAECRTTERWANNSWLKYAILNETQQALQRGEREQFMEQADVLFTLMNPLSSGNAEYIASTKSRFYGEASTRAFDAGHLQLGIECLKQQASVGQAASTSLTSQLIKVNSSTMRNLMKLTPQDRHDTLFDLVWNMPILGLVQAAQIAPQDDIPERFVRGYKNYRKTEKLPLEHVTGRDSRSVSLLEWVMRDAVEVGQLEAVQERIDALEESGSDDAVLAKVVLAKAQGQELDLGLVRTKNKDGTTSLRSAVQGRGPLLPLDFEIAATAIANEATRQEGLDLAERLTDRALQNRSNTVLQGRMLAGLAKLQSDDPPTSSRQLVHFVKADDFTGTDIQAGRPKGSLWFEKSVGTWEHLAGLNRSSLLLKYPLLGKFEISFRCTDETYGESGATFGGLYMDFRGYMNNVAFDTLGNRTATSVPNEHIKTGDWTNYSLKRDSDAGLLTLACDGNEVSVLNIAADEFPFYGLQSMMHRKMTTEGIRIDGDVKIPESLQLVTPSLMGWSARFKGRRLPPVRYLENTKSSSAATESQDKADVPYEWHNVDGVIESVNHEQLLATDKAHGKKVNEPKYKRREEWLYYVRPLCDGEQVSFEFYQEAGKFSVHPTIDRMAVWFDEPQLRQHWITCDGGSWFGVSSTNRVSAPKASVLGQAELQEAAWNSGRFRREADNIILAINGQDIYQQPVDETLGGRFGFFHDPTLFHVRLRNLQLTGVWPSALPEDLFEKTSE